MASLPLPPTLLSRFLTLLLVLFSLLSLARALVKQEQHREAGGTVQHEAKVEDGAEADDERYVGYCITSLVYMWPDKSRNFWSYGYTTLMEPYPANCTLKYTFNMRLNPSDAMEKYGFKITGTFTGPNVIYSTCTDTDYVFLNDGDGNNATFCGDNTPISYITGSNYFEFHFISQENSVRAKGFYVTIESFYLCGGTYTHLTHGPSGFLTSPLHSDLYPPNTACSWFFSSSDETSISMHCSAFLLESYQTLGVGSYCPDSLSITSEVGGASSTTNFCSTELAAQDKNVYSKGNYMLVSFTSDSGNHYSGFNCTYEFILYAI